MSSPTDLASVMSIAYIPDDVLYNVFHLLARDSFLSGQSTTRPGASSVIVSHVCRHWRYLALSSPQLWSFLTLSIRPRLTILHEFLDRSRDAPFSLRLKGSRGMDESGEILVQMARLLSDHSGRILELHAIGFFPQDLEAFMSSLSSPAPLLQRCNLYGSPHTSYSLPSRPSSQHAPFLGWMPSLRYISLREVSIPWLPYTDLRELILTDQPAPLMPQFLSTLMNSPFLEILSLTMHGAISRENATHETGLLTVELAHLRQLFLKCTHDPDDVLHVLAHLSFPTTTTVSLRFCDRHRLRIDIGRYCPPVRNIAASVKEASIEFSRAWDHSVELRAMSAMVAGSSLAPKANLEVQWNWRSGYHESMLDNVGFAALQFPALQTLHIYAYAIQLQEEQWLYVLRTIPTVVNLQVDIQPVQESTVLPFFSALAGGPDPQVVNIVTCPNLTHLTVSRLNDAQSKIMEKLALSLHRRVVHEARRLTSLEVTLTPGSILPTSSSLLVRLAEVANKVNIHGLGSH
ncbi:hypothetical protein AcV5_009299 [Taiwanofungus camphoratus]|nr:hypothetical protein AcV5_009299 [Antrodia cinnamomea]